MARFEQLGIQRATRRPRRDKHWKQFGSEGFRVGHGGGGGALAGAQAQQRFCYNGVALAQVVGSFMRPDLRKLP